MGNRGVGIGLLVIFIFGGVASWAGAQTPTAPAAPPAPPAGWEKEVAEAPAVVLEDIEDYYVSYFKTVLAIKKRIKINSSAGLDWANQSVDYGGSTEEQYEEKLTEFSAQTVRPDGTVVPVGPDQRQEVVVSERGPYKFKRLKFTFPAAEPGAVLEWTHRIERRNLFPWPWWEIQGSIPVVYSRFTVHANRPALQSFDVNGYSRTPIVPYCTAGEVRQDGMDDIHEFSCRYVPTFVPEPLGPPRNDVRLRMMFTYDDPNLVGRDSWGIYDEKLVNRWRKFLAGRSDVKKVAREEIGRSGTGRERIERLGKWLRRKMNVLEGNGEGAGLLPGDAKTADETLARGQGKPLEIVLLTKALAEELDLKAYLAKVGDRKTVTFRPDLPDLEMNMHWVVEVNADKKLIVLDPSCPRCRIDQPPWRYCGGRNFGIRITEVDRARVSENQIPIDSPLIPAAENMLVRKERVALNTGAPAAVEGAVTYTGQTGQEYRDGWADLKPSERGQDFLRQEQGLIENAQAELTDPDDLETLLTAHYSYAAKDLLLAADGVLILRPRDGINPVIQFPVTEQRRYPLWWPHPFGARTEVTYVLPAGLHPAALPAPIEAKGPGMTFFSEWKSGAGPQELIHVAEIKVEVIKVPVTDYPSFRDFAVQVRRAFPSELVLEAKQP